MVCRLVTFPTCVSTLGLSILWSEGGGQGCTFGSINYSVNAAGIDKKYYTYSSQRCISRQRLLAKLTACMSSVIAGVTGNAAALVQFVGKETVLTLLGGQLGKLGCPTGKQRRRESKPIVPFHSTDGGTPPPPVENSA